jgi:hypothetical protein
MAGRRPGIAACTLPNASGPHLTSVIVNAMHLVGATPSGFGVYTRNIVQHTPWPEGTRFLGPAEAAGYAELQGRLVRVPLSTLVLRVVDTDVADHFRSPVRGHLY